MPNDDWWSRMHCGDHVAHRLRRRATGGHRASPWSRSMPMRSPCVRTNDSHTAWSSATSRPSRGWARRSAGTSTPCCAADALRAVDVVDRRQHLGVDALHVVRLARSPRRPPSSCTAPGCGRHAGSGTRRGRPTRCRRARPRGTRASGSRVGVEVHEHERAPRVDLHREQREVVVAQRAERTCATAPRAGGPRGPTSSGGTGTAARVSPSPAALADRVAAVTADVLERAQLAVVAAHDDHRVGAGAVLEAVAGLGARGRRVHAICHTRGQSRSSSSAANSGDSVAVDSARATAAPARRVTPTARVVASTRSVIERRPHELAGAGAGVGAVAPDDLAAHDRGAVARRRRCTSRPAPPGRSLHELGRVQRAADRGRSR